VKLCIHGSSLRFRLNRSDVEQFRQYQPPSKRNVNSRKAGLRRRLPLLARRICSIDAAVHDSVAFHANANRFESNITLSSCFWNRKCIQQF
jgi:hypothetical protein